MIPHMTERFRMGGNISTYMPSTSPVKITHTCQIHNIHDQPHENTSHATPNQDLLRKSIDP